MLDKPTKPEKENAKPRKREPAESPAVPDLATREAALDRAALQFKALGDPTRLRIVRLLSGDPPIIADLESRENPTSAPEWTVGDVNFGLFGKSKATSTLSHHLKELRNAGLITMKRRGKNLICRIHAEAIAGLCCELALPDDFERGKKIKLKERGKSSDGTEHAHTAPAA